MKKLPTSAPYTVAAMVTPTPAPITAVKPATRAAAHPHKNLGKYLHAAKKGR